MLLFFNCFFIYFVFQFLFHHNSLLNVYNCYRYKKFDDNNSIIKEPFQFCVTEIERKIWFYDLVKDGRDLDNEVFFSLIIIKLF